MDDLLTLHRHTLFSRGEAVRRGYNDKDLAYAVRHAILARPRYGWYADAGVWAAADEVQRFRMRGHAVALQHGDRVMLSHTSAAVELGVPLFEPDLSVVHVTRLDGRTGRIEAGAQHHAPTWHAGQVDRHGEILVADEATAVVGVGLLTDVERGLVAADAFLHRHPDAEEALQQAFHAVVRHPAARRLQLVRRLVRPGAQSVFESRCRYTMWRQHLPEPVLQWPVHDADGVLVGITDFAWPEHRLFGEADGRWKYGRLLGPNPTPEQISAAMVAEKDREDLIREITGWGVIRYVWGDLYVPERFARRTRAQLERYAGLRHG